MVLARWSSSRPATACMRRWPCWRRCSANEPRPADPGLLAPAPGGGPPHRSGRSGRRGRGDLHPLPAAAAPARDAGLPDPSRPDPARDGRHRFDDLHLILLSWLFRNATFFIVIAVIVMFQPELRR